METIAHMLSRIIEVIAVLVINHQPLILLFSVVVAAIFATVILLPRQEALSVERWVRFIGWAFLLFTFQYGLRFTEWLLTEHRPIISGQAAANLAILVNILFTISSSLNNLCFLAAAHILLNKKPALPRWALAVSIIAPLMMFHGSQSFWTRAPDSLFSAWCLGWIGYATAVNLRFSRRWYLGLFAIVIGGLYGFINILYAFDPYLATTGLLKDPASGTTANSIAFNKLDLLDSFAFAFALPLKFGLFLPAYSLLMFLVTSPGDLKNILNEVTQYRQDYLSNRGVIKTFGESLRADFVELVIRVPGKTQRRIVRLRWARKPEKNQGSDVQELAPNPKTLLNQVLEEGKEFFYPNITAHRQKIDNPTEGIEAHALIMAPVKFHGAVIGCLNVELYDAGQFNYAALQMVKNTAALLAPVVQDYRELAAMDQLSYRFARLQVDNPALNLREANSYVASVLDDVLSPLAMGLFVEAGFKSSEEIVAIENSYLKLLEEQKTRYEIEDEFTVNRPGEDGVTILRNQLVITSRRHENDSYPLGNLLLAVPAKRDEVNKPTLATYRLHRRAISSLVADALLDLARDHFGSLLKDFSIRLNQKGVSTVKWFNEVNSTALQAGLLWAVATQTDGQLMGPESAIKLVENLQEEERQTLEAKDLGCIVIKPSVCDTHHVIRINLRDSRQTLWLGVGREGFGLELDFASPWKVFLDHFSEIADAALVRLIAAREFTSLQIQAAHYQGLATVAVTTGTLVHQIVNLAKEQLNPSTSLLEAIKTNRLQVSERYEQMIGAIRSGAKQLLDLTQAITNVTKLDERRPCSLREAAHHAKNLFAASLSQREINLSIDFNDDFKLDIPYHVAALALANLISNAKDAIKKNGNIWIKAETDGDAILCKVTDNGPGVPDKIRSRVFDLGVHANPSGNGWGLYLVSRSLLENGGSIELTNAGPGGTTFTLRFPKPKQEKKYEPLQARSSN